MNEPGLTGTTPRDQRNTKRYIQLMLLWAMVYVASTFVLNAGYIEPVPLRWLVALLPSVFAAIAARAYWRYLRGMDELLRTIELKALALSITAGFVVWPAVELIEAGVPLDTEFPLVLLVITGCYAFGVVKGRMAYL